MMIRYYIYYFATAIGATLLFTSCTKELPFYAPPANKPDTQTQMGEGDTGADKNKDSTKDGGGPHFITETKSDSFLADYLQKQDLLFVVDNSGSMAEEIQTVKDNMTAFILALQARRFVDYQVAVTTTDARYTHGGLVQATSGNDIINLSSPAGEWESVMSHVQDFTNISTTSWNEMGLLSAKQALDVNGSRFLRTGVPLAVVIMSDEDDQSCMAVDASGVCIGSQAPVTNYVNYFKQLPTSTTVFTIAGQADPVGSTTKKCSSIGQIGVRYLDFATQMGGMPLGSICAADLASDYVLIAQALSQRGVCFKLTKTPKDSNIAVSVGSNPIANDPTNGFTFDTASNSVCFPGNYIVSGGQTVTVTYDTLVQVP